MASLITTMSVPFFSSSPPQPLSPRCTLTESSSCATIETYACLEKPSFQSPSTPQSPATRALRDVVDSSSPNSPLFFSRIAHKLRRNAKSRGPFKPRAANKGTTSYQLRQFAEATLGSGSLRKAVKLPEGEDLNEWLAVNSRSECLDLPDMAY